MLSPHAYVEDKPAVPVFIETLFLEAKCPHPGADQLVEWLLRHYHVVARTGNGCLLQRGGLDGSFGAGLPATQATTPAENLPSFP